MKHALSIKIDYREKRSGIPDILISKDIDVSLLPLPVGDYIINDQIIVERKTKEDFVSSIIKNSLFSRCAQLKSALANILFIVEGNPYKTNHKINENAIKGSIVSMLVSWQVPVIFSKNTEETAKLLCMIGEQDIKSFYHHGYPRLRNRYQPKKQDAQKLYFIEGLPGIGSLLASRLFKHFGNIKNLVNAPVSELRNVKGVGKKNASNIKRFFTKSIDG